MNGLERIFPRTVLDFCISTKPIKYLEVLQEASCSDKFPTRMTSLVVLSRLKRKLELKLKDSDSTKSILNLFFVKAK